MDNNFNIMDVTLRDGSYAVNFQFSEYETEAICNSLNQAGIRYIEIGHGMGLSASCAKNGLALCSDIEYLQAAQKSAGNAKYGMFCIPGVADLSDLELLTDYGASFVRIGSNVTEIRNTEKYIKKAKNLGLEVMANYMKSYVASPSEFSENVKMSEAFGADVVYIVDSAGSMDIDDITKYYEAIKSVSNIKVGFHGHNNLGLAVSNSLEGLKLGFDFIDTSLLGIGRSAGNAATEILVANLMKRMNEDTFDLKKLLDCSEKYVRPLWKHKTNALDLYCGIAEFHTSYIKYIRKYAMKYRVNPLDLIVRYSMYNKVDLEEENLDKIAAEMEKDEACIFTDFGFNEYIGDEQDI